MKTKNGRDLPIEQITAENYIVPQGEEMTYHCKIEVVQFNSKTGERISKPRIQKFGKKIFETTVLKALKKQGYTVDILHNPTKWIAEQSAKKAENAKAKRLAEKEQMKQEILAELAALGLLKTGNKNDGNGEGQGEGQGEGEAQQGVKRGRPAKEKEE